MKKALAMVALAAICLGSSAYAFTPVNSMKQDTTKTKIKKKNGKTKIKKKKDTTAVH